MILAAKVPTYDDICALPAGVTGQLVLGTLHAHPRPAMPHALDRGDKRKVYQREGVPWFWIVDPKDRTLEVLALDGPSYRVVDVFSGEEKVRVRPFDAIELDLAVLWAR